MIDLLIMACKGAVIASVIGLAVSMWLEFRENEDGY